MTKENALINRTMIPHIDGLRILVPSLVFQKINFNFG
jgi:hypothetical protein